MIDPLVSMAFTTGLLGSAHCLGMCGGLMAALAMVGNRLQGGIAFQLLYHTGRILTYTLIGLLVGWFGSVLSLTDSIRDVSRFLLIGSDLFIIMVGIASAGLLPFFRLIDLEGRGSFSFLQGSVSRLLRLPGIVSALPLGILLGFIPCGFVYAMAITAAQTTEALHGAALMAGFGLGTLPALVLFGSTAQWLTHAARQRMLRGAGAIIMLMGLYNLYRHLQMMAVIP